MNNNEQHVHLLEYCKMMQNLELGIPPQQFELDLPQVDDIKINARSLVMHGRHARQARLDETALL